jgi:isopentenyl-diphosphate delta-isomerase
MTLLFQETEHIHFLMQRRAHDKKLWPDRWTLSATGHVNKDDVSVADVLGYISTAEREAPEELDVTPINLKLVATREIKTEKNWAMAGVVVGEYEGTPTPNLEEVSEVRLFDRETILEIKDQLTPGALICLVLLGILQNKEKS